MNYKTIPNQLDYLAGDDGHIYSLKRGSIPKKLAEYFGKYFKVTFHYKTFLVHRLIAEAFLGPCPEGMEVLHGEKGQKDNTPANLSYGTKSQNQLDRYRDGTMCLGERNGNCRLTYLEVEELRELRLQGASYSQLGKIFNISAIHAKRIALHQNRKSA